MDKVTLNPNTHDGLLSAAENERAVPCPDVARWISTAGACGRKTAAARARAGLQALQKRVDLNEDLL